jgi:cell division transport system permease protein
MSKNIGLSVLRIIKFSLQDITRNIWLTIVTVTILVLALLSVNMLLTVKVISQNAIEAVKSKIDISLYLKPDASEEAITDLRTKVTNLDGVKQVAYVSKQDALISFREQNKDNEEILNALKELGRNPLSPNLIITPNTADEAPKLIENIKKMESDIIESRDFSDNTLLLEKINNITKKINQAGLFLILIFVFTSILVAYNSIKVAIYTHRKEIEIMRLVGAPNSFIFMPFLVSAAIFALLAIMIIITLFYPFLGLLQPYLEVFFTGYSVNILDYFVTNFFLVFSLQFIAVATISIVASWLAIRRYARV